MSSKSVSVNVGFPIFSITTLTFVVLKLIGKIDWDWVWVFAPLWIPLSGVVLFGLGLLVLFILAQVFGKE